MVERASLLADVQAVHEKLIQLLQQFTPEAFVRRPNSESWSAAEVAEHLLIINKNLNYVMQADGSVIPDRAPDKKLSGLKEALANRANKFEAPENVRPTGTVHDQQELIACLQKQLQVLKQIIQEKELKEQCEVYAHPRVGRLTRLEWSYFIVYHTQRHCQQLEDIYSQSKATV